MKNSKLLSIIMSIAIAVFILSAAIAFPILYRPFYYGQIDELELVEKTGLGKDIIIEAYDDVMDFLVGSGEFGTGRLIWSEDGKSHFEDCKGLFTLDFVLLGISFTAVIVLLILSSTGKISFHRFLRKGPAFWSAVGLLAFFTIAAVWALTDFSGLFTFFHHTFFPGKTNWIFDWRTDAIILILPEKFWFNAGALILALTASASLIWALAEEIIYHRKASAK